MNGGEGPRSYARNSSFQRVVIEANKKLIQKAIASEFDPKTHDDPKKPICIADLGCSTGPNTFLAMQYIIETIEHQYQSQGLAAQIPEFQVFFNDLVSNDFNTLFKTLPPNRKYFVAGVPGSFRGRLFPRETLHFVNSSSTLNWLSKIPKEIADRTSTAWNKGRIHHKNSPKEVVDAYATQYKLDLDSFLNARAQELVSDGLMTLQIPAVPDVFLDSDIDMDKIYELVGSCLLDMAKVGPVSEEKVDSFNFPIYYSPVKYVMAILERNGCFSIEQIKTLNVTNAFVFPNVQTFVSALRATLEGLLEMQFGGRIVDELFIRFTKKVVEYPDIMYLQNLKVRTAIEDAKRLIQEAIADNLDPETFAGPAKTCCIADLGCSTGSNTFLAVQGIVEAVELQHQSQGLAAQIPEFQVFFSDQISNDFNTLFKTLPINRKYFAFGVPGSFYGRLFPSEALHFVHSSSALHWLSKVPKEITDRNSTAWNKGRIHYLNAPKEVAEAYATQHRKDLDTFLHARAQELVSNGLLAVQMVASPDVILDSDFKPDADLELLGSCLVDMAKVGFVGEEKLDSFNVPICYPPVKDVKEILERNGCFSIQRMEALNLEKFYADVNVEILAVSLYRTVLEELIEKQFGRGIIDELFDRFAKKLVEFPNIMYPQKPETVQLFVLLKRKPQA